MRIILIALAVVGVLLLGFVVTTQTGTESPSSSTSPSPTPTESPSESTSNSDSESNSESAPPSESPSDSGSTSENQVPSGVSSALENINERIRATQGRYYNADTGEDVSAALDEYMALRENLTALIESQPENAEAHYQLARVQYEIFERYTMNAPDWGIESDEELAEHYLEASWKSAERAIELDETLSDAHRLVAQNVNRLIPYKGTGFAISNSAVPQREARIALQHDEENAMAYMARGQAYMFTPVQFGGNPQEATVAFQSALEFAEDEHETFLANVWLGWSYITQEKHSEATPYLETALEIYPNSTWASWLMSQVEG